MSDVSREPHTSRRKRREDYGPDSEDSRSRRKYVERPSKRRSPDVKSEKYREHRKSDDSDNDRSRTHRRRRQDDDTYQDNSTYDFKRERKYRHRSRSGEISHHQTFSRSPPSKRRRRSMSNSRSPAPRESWKRTAAPLPSQADSFRGNKDVSSSDAPLPEKQKPNYKPTGLLAKEANTVAGTTTVLKYHEPPEARKPPSKEQWRMYVFKQKDLLETVYLHRRSAWLLGSDEKVTDYLLEHPSTSKQHAVIQFRHSTTTNKFGDKFNRVKPYLIDLESVNGTKLNKKKIEASRYVELVDGDVIAFGDSEREYVLMLPPSEG